VYIYLLPLLRQSAGNSRCLDKTDVHAAHAAKSVAGTVSRPKRSRDEFAGNIVDGLMHFCLIHVFARAKADRSKLEAFEMRMHVENLEGWRKSAGWTRRLTRKFYMIQEDRNIILDTIRKRAHKWWGYVLGYSRMHVACMRGMDDTTRAQLSLGSADRTHGAHSQPASVTVRV